MKIGIVERHNKKAVRFFGEEVGTNELMFFLETISVDKIEIKSIYYDAKKGILVVDVTFPSKKIFKKTEEILQQQLTD